MIAPPAVELVPVRVPVTTPEPRAPERRRTPIAVVLLAFLLGAALAVLVTRELMRGGAPPDDGHAQYVARVRRALADSRYVSPPKENVRDLVAAGLAKFPDDPELSQLMSDAAHELVTQSMAARAGGDIGGARQLVHDASQLDPSDTSARILVAQYDQELSALTSGASAMAGPPKIVFEVPMLAKKGERVAISGRIFPGGGGAKAKIENVRVTILPNKKTSGGTAVPLASADARDIRATLIAPGPGSYDVILEGSVDGTFVRALRDLDVLP